MSSAREPQHRDGHRQLGHGGRELPGRLVEDLGLAALVLAGHALGGGSLTVGGVILLAGATLAVTTLARHVRERSATGDVVLLVLAQAAGHLALALGGGETGQPATGRMLLGHAVSTVAVAALARHGQLCWHRAGQVLARAVRTWAAVVLPPEGPPDAGRRYRRDDERRPAGPAVRGTIARRGPPGWCCAAYA